MPSRPTDREIIKKCRDALDAVVAGRHIPVAVEKHLVHDLDDLEIETDDLWDIAIELLKEIQGAKPELCYAGSHPPLKSYEPEIKDEELWAFTWESGHFGRRMYLKFAMRKNLRGEWVYCHVRLHEDRG
jgi:hypothetical protein